MSLLRNLILTISLAIPWLAAAQLYTYKMYNRSDGLATQAINCVTQDKNGYLFLGTDGAGIMRYDGYHFEYFEDATLNTPLHVSKIEIIDNEVFFATRYGGVWSYYNGRYHAIYQPNDNSGETFSISNVNKNLGVFTTFKIALISRNGKELSKKVFPRNYPIRYHQLLNFPYGTIAFTNHGNFVLTEKGVFDLSTYMHDAKLDASYAGYYFKNHLIFFDRNKGLAHRFSISKNGDHQFWSSYSIPKSFFEEKGHDVYYTDNNRIFHISEQTNLTYLQNNTVKSLAPNYSFATGNLFSIFVDRNKTYWVSTSQGLIKISNEPFTKIEIDPIYSNSEVSFLFRDVNKFAYVGTYANKLYYGEIGKKSKLKSLNLLPLSACETPIGTIIATTEGLYINRKHELEKWQPFPLNFKNIQSVFYLKDIVYICPINGPIYAYNLKTKQLETYSLKPQINVSHIYTIQYAPASNQLYLGTNNGLLAFDLKRKHAKQLKRFNHLGSYCGTGITDAYGNIWFSFDKGLGGIMKNGEYNTIADISILKSVLTYTLSSDQYGKIYIGSNLGINVLQLDSKGNVLSQELYNTENGFNGYETNMRGSFQDANHIFLGTVNGVYSINTKLLNNTEPPNAPLIFKGRMLQNGAILNDDKDRFLSFRNILPRNKGLYYTYRIVGYNDSKWSPASASPEMILPKLENGKYLIEVKSSYDKKNYSPVSKYPITINQPIWQSKWFIVILIVLLGFGNILYLEWTSSGLTSPLGEFNHETIDAQFLPKLMLFGTIICILLGIIETFLINESFTSLLQSTIISVVMIISYFTSYILYKRNKGGTYLRLVFYFGLIALATHFYILLYRSNVHPYPLIAILLLSTVLPYTITSLRTIVAICVVQVTISISILLSIEKTIYNEFLYITAIVSSAALTILITYLRNDSLEKLIFVSNILNKGEMIVISFDKLGNISYVSKNTADFFLLEPGALIGKPLSALNPLVVSQEMRELSLIEEFIDGKIILVPMYNKAGEVIWIEFSCKEFSDEVKVVIGRDVTEKLTISTNYQSLVENAQDMIFNTDINGNFVYLNEMSSRVFGFRNENLVGQNSMHVIHPDYRKTVQEFYENQFKNRIKHTYLEFPIRTKEGRIIWLGQNATMTFEPGSRKRVSGYIALARDITEKRANELLIEQQNKDITESINSAKRIQFNLLPKASELHHYFEDSFLWFKPKDIVSGDFYWFHQTTDKFYVALSDCTGHGIPGAFMTIMGINLLNTLIIERKLEKPSAIVNALHHELDKLLHADINQGLPEGMQILVCCFEKDTLNFASSGVSLMRMNEGVFDHYRSTRDEENFDQYTCTSLKLEPNDQIYLITDGYQKQFGSNRNKKFSFKRIRELLERIGKETMPLQRKYFENAWSNWSEGHEQTDDITVMGLKNFKGFSEPKSEQE